MKKNSPVQKKSKPAAPQLKGWKRWAFPLVAMVLIPSLFFVLLEVGLRVVDYGFPTEFLIKRTVGETTIYTDNVKYGWRFFPPQVARRPADIVLPATKATNAFRVFVLGESAAMGDPDTAYGLPRMLEVMLSERFPSVRFEVINAAMTGISSHIIQDIAKDCARFEPDCFVIYIGNNEAIGPYGPGTVFASFSRYLALTRLSISVRSLKTSQLVEKFIRSRSKSDSPDGWGGLRVFMKSQFHPSDPRLAVLAEHFEANLKTICETGRKAGAKLVLATVASNLKDCSPFASLNNPSLSVEQKKAWETQWELARKNEAEGKIEAALKALQDAEAIDGSYADLNFRKAALDAALQRPKEAAESFVRARDCDALRFRTSSDLNSRVKQLSQSFPDSEAAFADVVKVMDEESAATGVGGNYFDDHVHFNFHGNYVAAREIAAAVSKFVPTSGHQEHAQQPPLLTEEQCAERLAFSPWNRKRIAEYMLKRLEIPPFNSKMDAEQRLREIRDEIAQLKDAESPASLEKALALYRRALERQPSDPYLLKRMADLHLELSQSAEEIKCHQKLYEMFPYDPDRKAYLAEALSRSDNFAEGEKLARDVINVEPSHVIAHIALATALQKKGAVDEAIAEYEEVLRWRPDMVIAQQALESLRRRERSSDIAWSPGAHRQDPKESQKHFERGQSLAKEGQINEALKEFQIATRLDTSFTEAHIAVAEILAQQGRMEEAIAQAKEAVKVRPGYVHAHNYLGVILNDLGRLAEARTHLEEAIRLEPDNDDVQLNLGLNLLRQDRPQEAVVFLEKYAKKHSSDPIVLRQMGAVYEDMGNWEKAAGSYREALRLQPDDAQNQSSLSWILSTSPVAEVRNGEEAVRLAEAANRAPEREARLLDVLAAAFAETSRYPEALKAAEEALALARAAKDTQTAEDIDKRIALYRSNNPFRSEERTSGATAAASKP